MFRWVGRRAGPGGVRRIEVPTEARARGTLERIDYADAFSVDVDPGQASAERWGRAALADAPAAARATLIAGWSSLGLRLGRGPGSLLGWSVEESTADVLLLEARSRIGPGISAQLLLRRREHDLLFCTFVMFHSPAARRLWVAVEPIHVRVVPELLEDARARGPAPFCCEMMRADQERVCDQHPERSDCPDALIERFPNGHHVLLIHDGGTSGIQIAFCPWCATRLPGVKPTPPHVGA